ncbi:MAG: DMT family transporter [Chryseolinea sp.]
MSKPTMAWSLLLLCNLMWALQFTCIKLVQDQVGPFSTVFLPMLMATLFLLPFVYKDVKANQNRKLTDLKVFAMLAIVGQFPAQVLTTFGTQRSTASNAAIISLSLPIISALLAFIILKAKMTRIRWFCFFFAIAGVILCSLKDIFNSDFTLTYLIGNLLIFLGVFGSGFYNTYCKKIAEHYTEMEMLFYTYIFMIVLLAPFVWQHEGDVFRTISSFTTRTWTGIVLLTLFHNFLSMLLFFKALKTLDAIQVAFSNFLITFFGLPIAAIWLHEKLNLLSIVGGLLVLMSTLSITILEYRKVKIDEQKSLNL